MWEGLSKPRPLQNFCGLVGSDLLQWQDSLLVWPFCPPLPGTHPLYSIPCTTFSVPHSLAPILCTPFSCTHPCTPQPQAQAGNMNCQSRNFSLSSIPHLDCSLILCTCVPCTWDQGRNMVTVSGYRVCLASGLSLKLHWCGLFFFLLPWDGHWRICPSIAHGKEVVVTCWGVISLISL